MARTFVVSALIASSVALPNDASGAGQNTNDINGGIQFEFAQPAGARSQGIGGAFVAVADDATTAHDNPAGLVTFTRPEVSAEVRHWNWKSTIADRGHAFGPPSTIGIDTIAGVVQRTFESRGTALSFASLVYPFGRASVGIFRREVIRYEMERQPAGAFFHCSGGNLRGTSNPTPPFCEPHATDGIDRLFPARQSIQLDVSSIGGSAAFGMTNKVSVGVGAEIASFEMSATNKVFSARGDKKFLAPDYSDPANLELQALQSGDDRAPAFHAGVLWRLDERWSTGAAFHRGPEFAFRFQVIGGTQNLGGEAVIHRDETNVFKVPDHYSAGLALRPNPFAENGFLLFSAQYERVNFSQIMTQFVDAGTWRGDAEEELTVERLMINDVNRVRFGGEYVRLISGAVIAVRGGLTYDPEHQLHFRVDDAATGMPAPRTALYFPKGSDDVHFAFGLGAVFGRFQVDAAVDTAEARNTFVLSTVIGLR